MTKNENTSQRGNTGLIVLVVLAVGAVGALTYFSGKMTGKADAAGQNAIAQTATADGTEKPRTVIKPGNPVVAKVGNEEIKRLDVFNYIQTLPEQTRQIPAEQIFPIALDQVINAKIIQSKTQGVNLDNDPEVRKQMALAKDNIVRSVYIQKQVEEKLTEGRVKTAYEQYKANFPDVDEVKARHILVKDEAKAKELLEQIKGGADFAELAKANSLDGTAENGGEVGYFAKADVVPAFAEAAFALEPGTFTQKPVKTDFGYHIIQTEEKRKRQPATYEEAKPFLEAQLRRQILDEIVQDWRSAQTIETFDINGESNGESAKPAEPAAGE